MVGVRRAAVSRHLHAQLPPVQHGPVHGVHRVLGVALVVEANEGEAAAFLGVAVPRDVDVAHPAVLLEHAAERLRGRAVRQVVHFQGRHALHIGWRPPIAHICRGNGLKSDTRGRKEATDHTLPAADTVIASRVTNARLSAASSPPYNRFRLLQNGGGPPDTLLIAPPLPRSQPGTRKRRLKLV